MKIPDTIKRAFSRPIQIAAYIVLGITTQHLLPSSPDVSHWVAYGFIYVAMLALGLDNYNEGFQRGLKFWERLDKA